MQAERRVRFHPDFVSPQPQAAATGSSQQPAQMGDAWHDDEPTELKLAILASLYTDLSQDMLLDALLTVNGSVSDAQVLLGPVEDHVHAAEPRTPSPDMAEYEMIQKDLSGAVLVEGESVPAANSLQYPRLPASTDEAAVAAPQRPSSALYQTSIAKFFGGGSAFVPRSPSKPAVRKGQTLHLYTPESVALHTPCTLVPNFLPAQMADDLLKELMGESPIFVREAFKLFDRVVSSPHTTAFYVDPGATAGTAYAGAAPEDFYYNGSPYTSLRQATPHMRNVSSLVEDRVNAEVESWTQHRGGKLLYQNPRRWKPNTCFVNCYDGPSESVGYHADQLTYLGPRTIIGSVSLGVEREFRVRRIFNPADSEEPAEVGTAAGHGQIAIHLPHNSLLVMHADMQETHKHAVLETQTIQPHPLSGGKRINLTYRHYRDALHPSLIPKCRCGVQTVLRPCMRGAPANRGRYMWMCHTGYQPDVSQRGCGFFEWAVFDCDGEPSWSELFKGAAEHRPAGQFTGGPTSGPTGHSAAGNG